MGSSMVGSDEAAAPVEGVSVLLYDVVEAATALNVSRSTVYELLRNGDLDSIKIRRRRLIPRRSLEVFVASLAAGS